ncbi:MAG TPA: transposase [Xanthobacteraceae bacterium]
MFRLTCSKYPSGKIDRSGRISRCGDEMMRVMLYEAAQRGCGRRNGPDSRSGRCRSLSAPGGSRCSGSSRTCRFIASRHL